MEENNKNKNNNKSASINIINPVITMRDLLLFKEEMLKDMREYQSQINASLTKNYDKYNKLLETSNNKLNDYEKDNSLFMKQIEFIEEKNKIMSLIQEKEKDIKNQMNVNNLHINECQKQLDNSFFKYDKSILDNMIIPGVVGKGCKFLYLKDYIKDIQEQINNSALQNKKTYNIFNSYKTYTDGQLKQLNTKIKNLELESKQYTSEKTLALDKKFNQMMETMNNQVTSITREYYKTNIELRNKIKQIKKLAKFLIEENRKINHSTLSEFEIIKKNFKKIKKNIIELSVLLTPGASMNNKNKFNRNSSNNRQLIIQGFNNMIIGLMKEVTKENNLLVNDEINSVLYPKKNVGSVIKKYIEGKIHAEDTKFEEKNNNKLNSIVDPFNSSPPKKLSLKTDDLSLFKNSDLSIYRSSDEKRKRINRQLSIEYRDNVGKFNFGSNNNNNDSEYKRKIFSNKNSNKLTDIKNLRNSIIRKSNQINVIKEEDDILNNNQSKSINDSSLEDFYKELKIDETENNNNKKNEGKHIHFYNTENNFAKFNKKFFRAVTSNYDNKFFGNRGKIDNTEDFKLLFNARQSLKKNNYMKKKSFKNDNTVDAQSENEEKNKNINESKYKDDNLDKNDIQNNNKIINENISENISEKNIQNNEDIKSSEKKEKTENKENKEKEINIKSNESKIKIIKKSDELLKNESIENKEININNHNSSSYPKYTKSNNMNNIIDNSKNKINQTNLSIFLKKNISPETSLLKFTKNKININNNKNLAKKEKILSLSDNFNNDKINSNNQIIKFENINSDKNIISSIKNIKKPFSIISPYKVKPESKYKIKNKYNLLNEDIFINKNDINKINYCKDEDIIDKPLLTNQTNFKVDNVKGSLENKLLELEYFTKKKLDELVREIKNFIPIHFNAYIKE